MAYRLNAQALREYDIRGVVGEMLDEDAAYAIGRSFATVVRRAGGRRVVVGRDGRLSSPMLEAALVRGLAASGVDVMRIGVSSSPMLYFAEATLEGVDAGVQVTGSHNPADQNGFKLKLQHQSFWGDELQQLARLAAAGDWEQGAGEVSEADVLAAYADRLVRDADCPALRIGWDTGNGAAGPAIEALTQRLPGEHHLLFTDVDGDFPHHHPDPSVEANLADLKRLVADKRLDFGLAFDGDGDRIGAVDAEGRALGGDQILAILAQSVLLDRPGSTIIADVKSSKAFYDHVAAHGGTPLMGRTGHSPIKIKLIETGAPLAGELSGHIFFADRWFGFDDAPYAAVRLIEAVGRLGTSLTELGRAMPVLVNTPDIRIAVAPERKAAVIAEVLARLEAEGRSVIRIDGVRVNGDNGWWLLRASNTENALTVRAEARDRAGLDRLLAEVDAQLIASGVRRG